jgi:hypothetical protein
MKFALLFLSLLSGSPLFAGPAIDIQDDNNVVHELAHGAAGALVALAVDYVWQIEPSYHKHPVENVVVETLAAIAANCAYESLTDKTIDESAPRVLAGAIGGLIISYRINFP